MTVHMNIFVFCDLHIHTGVVCTVSDDSRLMEAQEALLKEQMHNEELAGQVEFLNSVIIDLQVRTYIRRMSLIRAHARTHAHTHTL